MNLSQITAFRAVMNSASLSEAAKKLGRTQPAVSLAIRSLEDTLGLKLFERRGRQLVPVPEAHYLLTEASDILDRLSAVAGTMKGLISGQSGQLNIASMPGPSTFLLPRYISRATQDNPDIRVSLSSRTSLQIRELAATQSFDFGFADLVDDVSASKTYKQELITADCYCAIPHDHPLAAHDAIQCCDLDGVPLGSLQSTHVMHKRTIEALSQAGVSANIVLDSQYFLPLMQFISAGRCFSIVDPLTMVTETEMNSTAGRVVFRPMHGLFRYEYALLSPLYRPLSQLASQIKDGWRDEVIALLDGVGASPRIELIEPEL
ncbi:LysR substrate-binding domain-containing protein [Ruegeria sp. 2205SS24-7]|uniref:LysR family transcriptional regulator n=1 Tax=Ruegeria discodermiae TaxID=3064389 RepID=UPI002741D006|nr:LysR substrate-binding domain-containing protein [Ruegeria sp. 2205SS24-7]MDP5217937.1 LysR substrate-binding domain-containing protein [Ruegeria sp. 2205SS24-7]